MSETGLFTDYNGVEKHDLYPYESNGGSIVAIAGDDFAVIAADTRLSNVFNFNRKQNKLFNLSDKTVLGSTRCWCGALSVANIIIARMQMFAIKHQKIMSTNSVAQMVSILMYHEQFFPYNVLNVVAGLDENDRGVVYSYDPMGHCEITTYSAGGSAGALLLPVLENQIGYKNQNLSETISITQERAVSVITDTFISAAERDIHTGHRVIINIITKNGIDAKLVPLRKN